MATTPQIEVPGDLGVLFTDPARVRQAFQLLNLMLAMEVRLTAPVGLSPWTTLVLSGQNMILPIPLKLATPIEDSSATAASVSATLNLLLAHLRTTGQLPT